jgi:ATP-dependent DNA helicase RecG
MTASGPFLPLRYLKGVGPKRAEALAADGFATGWDLLSHLPFRYEDRREVVPIASLREPGRSYAVRGRITALDWRQARRRNLFILKLLVADESGFIPVTFFNQRWLLDVFQEGMTLFLYGKLTARREWSLDNPRWELAAAPKGETGRVVPVYPSKGGLNSRQLGLLIGQVLDRCPSPLPDPLPADLAAAEGLPPLEKALRDLHRPEALEAHEAGRQRLIFDELFTYELALLLARRKRDLASAGPRIDLTDAVRTRVRELLPFKLTEGQKEAVRDIVHDMASGRPMRRLLHGDVGCGKTIVAAVAAVAAVENGHQAAFMTPTAVLAEQHYARLAALFARSGYTVRLLTSGTPAAERRAVLAGLADGSVHLTVGTHALLEDPVVFRSLGLAVVDEEHRFGVRQRLRLRSKGDSPHYLVMTATPIPRTLTLTLYGDLDVTAITQMPPGRTKVKTLLRPEAKRSEALAFIRKEAAAGRQAFLVYPLIEESENFDARALKAHYDAVAAALPSVPVAMLHGRLPYRDKEAVMRRFAAGGIGTLVATTVVEVGVDVPNATVMLVESAERFGLAQLHQLRGRVGRSSHPSYCILLHGAEASEESLHRLRMFERIHDGFALAEEDWALRGPGDLLGLRQWGLPRFRAADLFRDRPVLERARQAAARRLGDRPLQECEALARALYRYWTFEEAPA